jgi:hypothetical protein
MRGIAIRVGIIAAIVVGGLVLRQFLSGNAGDLKVGECFDVPTASEDIEDVQHHPCTDAHTGEVFFVGEAAAEDGAAYPETAALAAEVYTYCDPAFETYTGKDSNTDPEWSYGFFYPNEEQWADNSRLVICYASRIDEGSTKESIKQ